MDGNTVEDNYRPTQELNSRTVYYHDAMGEWIIRYCRMINNTIFLLSRILQLEKERRIRVQEIG